MTDAAEGNAAIYRRRVGDVLVTAMLDGEVELPPEVLVGVTPAERESLLRGAGRRPPFVSSINAFLLQWPDRTVLVDTGAGSAMGGVGGALPDLLTKAGVTPASIGDVLLTHLHVDHVGGLVDGAGTPVFAAAKLWVAADEIAFWENDAIRAAAPAENHWAFDGARAATKPYADRTERFQPGPVLPGVEAIALPGHTPGHTGFLIDGGTEKLLIWGDVMHVQAVQQARPEVSTAFDTDKEQAARSRRSMLELAAAEDLPVTGMHLSFPGFYRVATSGTGFSLLPEVWRVKG